MNECTNSPINPNASEECNLQGIELGRQGKMPEAAQCFQKAISLNPRNITAYSNLGVILAHYGQFAESRTCFAQALALDPNNAVALTNDALILLLQGQFAEGWKKYEHRPCLKNGGGLKNLWNGSPIPNQVLLVIHEQGSGDTIQFIRYLPIIRELCGKLIFLCPPSLKPLMNGFPGIDVLIDNIGAGVECHASIELLSLPGIVNTTPETIPANVPYLSAPAEKAEFWKKTMAKDKLNVGLAWAGNPRNAVDWKRSLHLNDFMPLIHSGIVFHSLQVGDRSEEAEQPPEGMRFENPAKHIADFSDTAGIIENLDLIIAVDTAVAHLAGAMGKPLWILLPLSPDWRWMLGREDSPWYPTARLFRQSQPDNWTEVIQRVAGELHQLVQNRAAEHCRQAAAYLKENKPDDALALAESAISLKPDYADAHFIRGYLLQSSGNLRSVEESFRVVISAKPEIAEAHFGLGVALQNQGRHEDAIECYQRALALNPKHINACRNLGNLFAHYGQLEKARECFAQALALDPDNEVILTLDGIALLLQGHLAEGWQKYERWQRFINKNGFPNRWDGSAIPQQTLLIHYQGGFGDTLHFIRYLPIIRERCGKLIFISQPELIPLINGFPGIDIVTDKSDNFKYQTSIGLLSLPGIMNTTLETIPADIPYLSAPAEKAGLWKKTRVKDKLNVGLVWAGSPKHLADGKRSLHLSDFAPLAHPGVVFHSLQMANRSEEAEHPPEGMHFENPAKHIADFSDTAAIIENSDLVISVDTAAAHLAGAMGKPVWILLPFYPDWRWMLNREDSPWYPTARLFRQSQPDVWTDVIQRVSGELHQLVQHQAAELRHQAVAYLKENKPEDALKLAEAAISLKPDYADAHFIRGYVLQSSGNMTSAEESFRVVVSAKPEIAEAHYGIGVSLQHQKKYKEAIECYQRAVALNPKHINAYNNMGNLFSHYGQFAKARECFAHIRAIDPSKTITLAYEALSLLLEGNFSEGWKKYEYRPSRYKAMIQKKWDGSAIPDQTIMVLHEQGFGDTIQFIRYLPMVKAYCQKLVFVCQPQLKSLFSGFPGIDVLMDNSATTEIQCHAAIELLSIPGVFNTNAENIPNKVPYLFADPEKAAIWKQNLLTSHFSLPTLNVGLVWSGNSGNFGDWERSLHLCDFAPLAHPGVVFHSLQVAHRAEEAAHPPEGMKIENPTKNIADFSDTAAIIENLDLVISVDTAVAHLAGAMGKPVWVLLPFTPDWRWMLNREDSPWYPTARLFRQPEPDNWADVMLRVANELKHLVGQRATGFWQASVNATQENRLDEALALVDKAIALAPDYLEAVFNRGYISQLRGDMKAAEESFRRAISIKSDFAQAYFGLGGSLMNQGRLREAADCYEKILTLNSTDVKVYTYNNLAFIYSHDGQFEKARACFAHAIALGYHTQYTLTNEAMLLLLQGDFVQGWQKYEARSSLPNNTFQNKWNGSEFPNQTLAVLYEQGLGDTIQFIRYLPMIRRLCGKLIFVCQSELMPLINGFPGIDLLTNSTENIECHTAIELLSIPGLLNTSLNTIPAKIPYLAARPEKAGFWKKTMAADKLNVGLVWAGNSRHIFDWKRSLHLSDFAPLAAPGVLFHSLQVAHRAEEATHPPEGMQIENPIKNIADFSDTAAIIENLDLVISVDTAVAHLAGAMGKPVWILLPFSPDWRWMLGREDSPWYPTARLFRQSEPDVWADLIQRVADELKRLVLQKVSEILSHAQQDKPEEALALAEKAISLAPDYIGAHYIRGYALQSMGNMASAEESFRRVISIKPDFTEAHFGLGAVLQYQSKYKEAMDCYQQALRLNPKYINAYHNLGYMFVHYAQIANAKACYANIRAIDPNDTESIVYEALMLLLEGNFAEGWEKYEYRPSRNQDIIQKRWDGTAVPDQIITVLHEQGFGDTIQFIRYLPIVRTRCQKLVFVCQPQLKALLSGFPGIDLLADNSTQIDVNCHAAIELLSLPRVFKTNLENIPNKVPYLFADPEKAAFWKKTMAEDKLNVGLVWAGNPNHWADSKRSLHLSDFAPLADSGVVFHSLQIGYLSEEADQPPAGMRIENPTKNIADFSDTAAIIENLDLVISIDTAAAHLAGAMGKPVWVLLPFSPDWRWMLNREDSPWYPTARLFRQSQPDNWTDLIQRVADILKLLVSRQNFKKGFALQAQNKIEEAIESYQQVIAVNPKHAVTHNNLGFIYLQNGDYEKANECFVRALEIDPNYGSALFNQSLILLLKGHFREGWQKYEYRPSVNKDILQKKWDGSPIENQTLLVVYEQGLGDMIQFMRYLPIVRERCENLIFICHPEIKPLINFPGIEVLINDQARTVQCNVVIQLLSIPLILNTTIENIPANIPYISANPEKAALWKKTMAADKLNVGLIWAGNPSHLADARRSLHLSDFSPLANSGVVFHSLQVEHRAEEANQPPEGMRLENPAKDIKDFSDTAAIIENLDLVISVDTAVAHLAGAMGKPVWILLPFSPDWRWMLNREDSPWYPTARLFRQSQPDVWTDVIQRVAGELNHIVWHRAAEFYRAAMNCIRENKLNEALALTDKAIAIKPDFPDAVFNRGYIFKLQGNHKGSEESFRRFIELKSDHAEAYLGLGLALQEQGRPKEAEEYYRQALVLNPNHTEVYLALGNALKELGRTDEAIESYHQTLRIDPNHAECWKGLGMVLKEQGKMQESLKCYDKALSLDPKNVETWISIGNLKKAMGDLSGSIENYRQTLEIAPDEGRVHSFLALALLLAGDFDAGWEEYEWRWEIEPLSAAKRHYSAPRWNGEPLNGKRVFLYGEQGFGDILQFVRYVRLLKDMGARIFLECYQELIPIISRMSEIDAVVVPNHQIPAFDYHCPLMSLPYIFKTNLNSIPANVPYLSACPEKSAFWKNKLATCHFPLSTLKVGIVWAGNPDHKKDRERSIPLSQLAPILNTPGVKFFSLQVGVRAKDIQESCAFGDIVDLSPELKNFDDTAAVMSALDLIISVDTAAAHLAGALGRPVWIMLQFAPDFRWLWGREDSPWYPSARLFRQSAHNQWEPVIQQIATDLTPQPPSLKGQWE